ncbi:MAG: hydrogenase [Gammaproteobacteria bacterium]
MLSPIIDRLIEKHGYPLLNAENCEDFIVRHDAAVLFFPGNLSMFPESNDVGVILPELLKALDRPLSAAVVDTDIERELQRRYRFTRWPALVFLKNGAYQGCMTGILNWHDFLTEGERIINTPPGEPPPFDLDQICSGTH